MASEKFRYQLRQEAQQWQEEGLIDPNLYAQLATRYQLDELDSNSRDRFIFIVLGVGFILLGLGVMVPMLTTTFLPPCHHSLTHCLLRYRRTLLFITFILHPLRCQMLAHRCPLFRELKIHIHTTTHLLPSAAVVVVEGIHQRRINSHPADPTRS